MPTVVTDAGPLHYLALIEVADILPSLFGRVMIPEVVRQELMQPATPATVLELVTRPPTWLISLVSQPTESDPDLAALDNGERATITAAISLKADLLLMDDRAGVAAARAKSFAVTGTLGLLDRASRRGLIDLATAFTALRKTNFHAPQALMQLLLDRQGRQTPLP